MKAKIDFNGTLEQFRAFTKPYKGVCHIEAIVTVVELKTLTIEEQAKEAALKHMPDNKIQAIKAVREITNWDLVTAKNFVEKL